MMRTLRRALRGGAWVAVLSTFGAPLAADHPGHGGHEGLLGGSLHAVLELGVLFVAAALVTAAIAGARRRTR